MTAYTIGSLFHGYGGLDMGAQLALTVMAERAHELTTTGRIAA